MVDDNIAHTLHRVLSVCHDASHILLLGGVVSMVWIAPSWGQDLTPADLNIAPELYEESPRLQDWLQEVPDVRESIRQDSALVTRVRVGYGQFPSTDKQWGWTFGVEDFGVEWSPLTVSGQYSATVGRDRETWGADLRYYTLPRGQYVNVAPVVGFRHIRTEGQATDGVTVGVRVNLALSRPGAADLGLQQVFVSPGTAVEVGITTLSLGYALTPDLRLATEIEKQNSPWENDSRVSVLLEWLP
jgi:hypothetical protein